MITLFTGSNQYALSQKLAELKNDFVSQYGDSGVEQYRGEQLDAEGLGGLLMGVSLFATNRFVVIKDLSQNKPVAVKLIELIKQVPEEVHVVLIESQVDKRTAFFKMLKKEAETLEFSEPDERELSGWISDYVKNAGGSISTQDASLLVQYVGVDQLRLQNELDKLLAFDSNISKETITRLVEKRPEDTIFQLLDSALSGQTNRALQILEELEAAHEDPYQIANMLIWQAHILAIAASSQNQPDPEVAKAAKINPFVLKKSKALANRLSVAGVNAVLNRVAQLDKQLKTSASQPWNLLEATIVAI